MARHRRPPSFYPNGTVYEALNDSDTVLAQMTDLKNAAASSAAAAEASNLSSAIHDASAAAHDTSAAAHDAASAIHDVNAAASAAAALVSETNAATSASSVHSSDVSAAAHESASATHDTNASNSATAAASSASAASTSASNASTTLNTFLGTYYGSFASDPVVDPLGNAPNEGDLYTNTTNGLKVYHLGAWVNPNVLSVFGRTGVIVAANGDYTASQLTNVPAGTIVAVTVQAALNELDTKKQAVSARGVANGYASLDAGGKIPASQIPAIAITDTYVVASQSAMLALSSAEQGDVAIRTDLNKSFILSTNSYSTLADWKELLTPTDAVLSVAGLTGAITAGALKTALSLAKGDVGLGNVDNTSDATKWAATATVTNKTISTKDNSIVGVQDDSNAAAGQVGEYMVAKNTTGTSLASGVTQNLISVTLGPGDWDVRTSIRYFSAGGATITNQHTIISDQSATIPDYDHGIDVSFNPNSAGDVGGLMCGPYRYNVAFGTTKTVYGICRCTYASGSITVKGIIEARRVR